ncbi:unnamed protein product [Paramecium primaurelia]|uniref:Uncharacterized protein n=1 Tax=Paramecium primaurelia TaxID=5886 RepID=A0A8S1P4N1_PARPR|nr:unnamed protein product [Paramecium primaurelia]
MSIIVYGAKIMNVYCGFQLTWKTCEAFKKQNVQEGDALLIKWFLLYTFIQFEPVLMLFLELIPFGYFAPFFIKFYIMLPHSRWHSLIYGVFEKLEMDEYTNRFFIYFTKIVKYFLVRFLNLIETCIDLVRVEELTELEKQVDRIMEKILNKKQSIEVTKSKIRFRNSETKGFKNNYVGISETKSQKLSVQASVKDMGRFVDYILSFNTQNSELQFICPQKNICVHLKTLISIDINSDKCLKVVYSENDGNLELMKLKKSEDIDLWLRPVIENLIEKISQQE